MVARAGQRDKKQALLLGLMVLRLHRKLGKRRRGWAADRLAAGRHVARGQRRQMYGAKFEALAAMDRHHPDRVHVGSFGRNCPINGVLIQRFDPAHAVEKPSAAGVAKRDLLAADLQQLVDRNKLWFGGGIVGHEPWSQIVAALEQPGRKKCPWRGAGAETPKFGAKLRKTVSACIRHTIN